MLKIIFDRKYHATNKNSVLESNVDLDTSFVATFKIESKAHNKKHQRWKPIVEETPCQVNELSPSTTINNTKTERTAVSNINCENPEKIEATRGNSFHCFYVSRGHDLNWNSQTQQKEPEVTPKVMVAAPSIRSNPGKTLKLEINQ